VMVELMITRGTIILVAWFIWTPLTSSSLTLGFFSAPMGEGGCIVYEDRGGGHCCWLDAGDWWIFCHIFLLLVVPIEQSMEGFLGWVRGVVVSYAA
jgi:hypothetical protein